MKHLIFIIGLLISVQICFADSLSTKKNESLVKQKLITDSSSYSKAYNTKEPITGSSKDNESKKDFDWNNLLSALLGGLIGLSPSIISYFRKPKIKGRIISQYANVGSTPGGEKCSIILQKVSLFSEHQNFFLKGIEIFVKFPNSSEIECKNWAWRALTFTFDENGKSIPRNLKIDTKEYLLHFTVFPKEKSIIGYISFTFDSIKDEKFEYIKYLFKDYKGNVRELKIDSSEIVDSTQIFDDSIWK
jgi:hypothetical protein